jgi:uncharacterized protein YdhG (YjbR/CyaY superfamily)
MPTPKTVDEYLTTLPDAPRAALERVRKSILATVPDPTETISYQMPAVRAEGRIVVWYAGFKDHLSLFPASEGVLEAGGDAITPFLSGKGTLRFTVEHPIPTSLVRKIVRARLAENAAARATPRRTGRTSPGDARRT